VSTKASETAHRLLVSPDARVTCPNCQSQFSLEEGLAKLALEKLEQSTLGALEAVREAERGDTARRIQQSAAQRDKAQRDENAQLQQLLKTQAEGHARALSEVRGLAERSWAPQLAALRNQLADSQAKITALTEREAVLSAKEQAIEARVEQEARAKAQQLFSADREAIEQQLAQKTQQVAELRSAELVLRKEKSVLQDRAAGLDVEVARKIDAGRAELEMKVRTQERERSDLEKADLQKHLADVNEQLLEAQRKSHQGSQQLQGEVLELTLERSLEQAFPLDIIEEVKKGMRGGDVVHRVASRSGQIAGILLWEAKRAKDWSAQWVAKLKDDMRGCNADVGVLVITGTALPKDWEAGQLFGLYEDIWVTNWTTALQLAVVLRSGLLELHKQRLVSAGKGEKMEAVYDYLTSSQFAQKLKAVYATFHRMRQELEAEKSSTMQRWARREKQLQTGVTELVGVAGDIQGLAQQELPLLEIGEDTQLEPPAGQEPATAQLGLRIEGQSEGAEKR
jgi:hypothetical protein